MREYKSLKNQTCPWILLRCLEMSVVRRSSSKVRRVPRSHAFARSHGLFCSCEMGRDRTGMISRVRRYAFFMARLLNYYTGCRQINSFLAATAKVHLSKNITLSSTQTLMNSKHHSVFQSRWETSHFPWNSHYWSLSVSRYKISVRSVLVW